MQARSSTGALVAGLLLAGVGSLAPALGQEEPPHDALPPPLAAPPWEIVPPEEQPEPLLAPKTAATITFEERVLEIVNEERLANGNLPPLKGVSQLFASSEIHSSNMADRDFFAHCDLDTMTTHGVRMTNAGYIWNAAGENIAAGFTTPENVMAGWMASPGHRGQILATNYREIGIGYALQGGDQDDVRLDELPVGMPDCVADSFDNGPFFHYWTQNFGRRNNAYPLVINREAHDTVCAGVDLYVYGPSGADTMRFSNDGINYSSPVPFSNQATWTLAGSASSNTTVHVQVLDGMNVVSNPNDTIFLGTGFPVQADLEVPAQTITDTQTFRACDTLTAGEGGFTVGASGDVTFHAGNRIVLESGFEVASGGTFTAIVGGL